MQGTSYSGDFISMESDCKGPTLASRLDRLNNVEKEIVKMLQSAQQCLTELSKDKQITKTRMEETGASYRNALQTIESELNAQIDYLSNVCVGSAHEGSTVGANEQLRAVGVRNSRMRRQLTELYEQSVNSD